MMTLMISKANDLKLTLRIFALSFLNFELRVMTFEIVKLISLDDPLALAMKRFYQMVSKL
jgi:hypothetical protein